MQSAELYNYNKSNPDYNLEESDAKNNFIREYILTYNSPYQTGLEINDRAYARLFLNKEIIKSKTGKSNKTAGNEGKSFLILAHGFSTAKKKLERYYSFINEMTLNNLSCAFINLPFHLNRTPNGEKSGERLIYFDDIQTLLFFHQSVVDIRRLADIITEIINVKNIYICGISMGSMISLITMANDERIKRGVFLIGGGNWEEIHWKGILRFILRGNCIYQDKRYNNKTRREACREIYSCFPEFLKEFKKLQCKNINIDFKELPELKKVTGRMCFLCDPLAFAHKINPRNVLMINSRFDFYFSRKSTIQLWKELGRPEICWLNKSHTSSILTSKKIISKIQDFLPDN